MIYGAVNFRFWRGGENVDIARYIKRFIFVKQTLVAAMETRWQYFTVVINSHVVERVKQKPPP